MSVSAFSWRKGASVFRVTSLFGIEAIKKSIQLGVYTKKCEFESIILSITSFVDREMRDASVFQCARGVCAMTSTAAVGGK